MSKERIIQKIKDNIIEVIYRHPGTVTSLNINAINEAAERIFGYFDVPQALDAPWPTIKELLDKVGELSMKLNMMQSSLREFEKQKVEPMREHLNERMDTIDKLVFPFIKRIDKLEERLNHRDLTAHNCDLIQNNNQIIKELLQRVDVLDKQVEFLKQEKSSMSNDLGAVMRDTKFFKTWPDYILKMDKSYDRISEELYGRIEKLEVKWETLFVQKPLKEFQLSNAFHYDSTLHCDHEWHPDPSAHRLICSKCGSVKDQDTTQGNTGDVY